MKNNTFDFICVIFVFVLCIALIIFGLVWEFAKVAAVFKYLFS